MLSRSLNKILNRSGQIINTAVHWQAEMAEKVESRFTVRLQHGLIALRHPVSSYIQATGLIISLIATGYLMDVAFARGTGEHVLSFLTYALTLVGLYAASMLFHSLDISREVNNFLRQLDQSMIYLLIVGSYTPICLNVLPDNLGWTLLIFNWALAAIGITILWAFPRPSRHVQLVNYAIYLMMGWLIIVGWDSFVTSLPQIAVHLIVLEGAFFTLGFLVLNMKFFVIIPGWFGAQEMWHVFVMAGCVCHYLAVSQFII